MFGSRSGRGKLDLRKVPDDSNISAFKKIGDGVASVNQYPNQSAFISDTVLKDYIPENEAGVKATSALRQATDEELFEPDGNNRFLSEKLDQQYHEHLRRKEEIRNRIEEMQREKNFLERLGNQDFAYML